MGLKRGLLVASIMTLSIGLSACGDEDALKEQISALQQQNSELQQQIDTGTIYENQITNSLKEVGAGGTLEFQSIEDKLIFKNGLKLDYSSADVSTSLVQIGSGFSFSPSNNWFLKTTGSQVDLMHPAKVWGTLKSVKYDGDLMQVDAMRGTLQQFYLGFPKTTLTYRNIFVGDYQRGLLSSASVTVDKKPYVVNAGFLTYGDKGVIMLFAYEDNQTGVQQELIDVLVRTGVYGSETIKLE